MLKIRGQSLEYLDWTVRRYGLQEEFREWSINRKLMIFVPETNCRVPREGPTVMDANVGHSMEPPKGTSQRPETYRVGFEPDTRESA